jgi:hypothetical protein
LLIVVVLLTKAIRTKPPQPRNSQSTNPSNAKQKEQTTELNKTISNKHEGNRPSTLNSSFCVVGCRYRCCYCDLLCVDVLVVWGFVWALKWGKRTCLSFLVLLAFVCRVSFVVVT